MCVRRGRDRLAHLVKSLRVIVDYARWAGHGHIVPPAPGRVIIGGGGEDAACLC